MTSQPATPTGADATSTTSTTATTSDARTAPTLPEVRPASPIAQVRALAGAEWRLLYRNKVALMNTLLMPALMVLIVAGFMPEDGMGFGALVPTLVLGTSLIFVVYYTLVTALVARREAHVLQRLRTGESSDRTILTGLGLPFVVITIVQTVLAVLGAALLLGVGMPANLGLVALATLGGTLVWTLLGIASTGITRSVEHAQITTLPLIFVPLLLSGIAFPLAFLPDWAQTLASWTPLHPIVELMNLGMGGVAVDGTVLTTTETFLHAGHPLLVLAVWTALGALAVRRYLRWEPRR